MSTKNLWGNLDEFDLVQTPVGVLKEQAHILTDHTGGRLVGVVITRELGESLVHSLNIRVPTLNNYEYTLLEIQHPVDLYPARILANPSGKLYECGDETAFLDAVESVLSSTETKKILSRLLSQIN